MLNRSGTYAAILVLQLLCAIFFVSDIIFSVLGIPINPVPWRYQEVMEIAAALGLISGVVLSAILLSRARRRTRAAEQALRVASGAFMELVEEHFTEWGFTPAERDVALFALKGMSLTEIAQLRETSEGTVKAQTNAIYRKAGVTGRPQFLSLFVEDLMGESLLPAPELEPAPRAQSEEPISG